MTVAQLRRKLRCRRHFAAANREGIACDRSVGRSRHHRRQWRTVAEEHWRAGRKRLRLVAAAADIAVAAALADIGAEVADIALEAADIAAVAADIAAVVVAAVDKERESVGRRT